MEGKTSWRKFKVKQYTSKYIIGIFISYKGKYGNFTVEKLGDNVLTKWSKLTSPAIRPMCV